MMILMIRINALNTRNFSINTQVLLIPSHMKIAMQAERLHRSTKSMIRAKLQTGTIQAMIVILIGNERTLNISHVQN